MKYYIHAFGDERRRLPDRDDIIEAKDDSEAHKIAWDKYSEYHELYVEKADESILEEFAKEGKKS